MNVPAKLSAAATSKWVFPWRYTRIALLMGAIYAVFTCLGLWLQGRWNPSRLSSLLMVCAGFGLGMAAFFAFVESRMMKRLGLPMRSGENVPAARQRREVSIPGARREVIARIEASLTVPGIIVERRDPAAGVFEAITEQTWKSYGERIKVSLTANEPTKVVIESSPRIRILGKIIDYGKNWENVEAIQGRLLAGMTQPVSRVAESDDVFCGTRPPKVLEAGSLWRLLIVLAVYALAAFTVVQRALVMPADAVLGASLLVTLPVSGALAELWAFAKFRLQVRAGRRSPDQTGAETVLTNAFPMLFALGVMIRPDRSLLSGDNIFALSFSGFFAYLAISRGLERTRERAQRMALVSEQEKVELERQLAEAKLVALSAQIEPHFLFNTLASIQYLTRHDAEKAHAMVSDLIRYLRLALPRMKQSTARLEDELQLVRAYLSIMQIRMGDRLRFVIDDPGKLGARAIPTMVLITLVENAIKHGLERQPGGGEIRVSVHSDGAQLALKVADTGGGFSTATSGTGIGLANIRERLKTHYQQRGQLELTANEPSGVIATVTLPLENV